MDGHWSHNSVQRKHVGCLYCTLHHVCVGPLPSGCERGAKVIALYLGGTSLAIMTFVLHLFGDFRRALLIALTLTSLTLGALPWRFLPVNGIAFSVQVGFVCLALSTLFIRRNTAPAMHQLFNPYNLSLFILAFIIFGYLLPSDNIPYGLNLISGFLVKGILPTIAISSLAPLDSRDRRIIVKTISVGSVLMALSLLSWGSTLDSRLIIGDDSSPITVGRVIGAGATLMLILAFVGPRHRPVSLALWVPLSLALLYISSLTGSRGPLVAAVFAILISILTLDSDLKKRGRALVTFALFTSVFVVIVLALPDSIWQQPGLQRIVDRFDTFGLNLSDRTRLQFFETAWTGFLSSSGVGLGTGAFASLYGVSGRFYPHNLVLELAVNQGIPGLLIFFLSLLLTFARARRCLRLNSTDTYSKALIGFWFYSLANAMVSMDIAGNYSVWISGGLIWLFDMRPPKNHDARTLKIERGETAE